MNDHTWTPRRVAILGASGLTGSGLAFQLAHSHLSEELILVDLAENLMQAHAIDIHESQVVTGSTSTKLTVASMDDLAAHGEVDLVVVTASRPETPAGDRSDFLAGNLEVMQALAASIRLLAGDSGLVMVLTNPAEVLTTAVATLTGLEPQRVFGYCLNDSIRLRAAIARELDVDPKDVEALVFGEHGDGQVPMYSRVRVAGVPAVLTPEQKKRIDADARGWFRRWSDLRPGRSSGWTTPVGSLQTIRRLANGDTVPAASWAGNEDDLPAVHVTLPSTVRDGRVVPVRAEMFGDELADVRAAAAALARRAENDEN